MPRIAAKAQTMMSMAGMMMQGLGEDDPFEAVPAVGEPADEVVGDE